MPRSKTMMQATRDQMKQTWEGLAVEAPMYWIASNQQNWTPDEFYGSDRWFDGGSLTEFLSGLGIDVRGKRVLDLGCGMGRISTHLARYGAEVYGTDISEEMIRLARQNLSHVPGLHFDVGDGISLVQYPDGFFDGVWSYITLRHIPSHEVVVGYLREIGRTLAPGGWILLEVGHFAGWQFFITSSLTLRLGLKRSNLLGKIGIPARPTFEFMRYNAFAGVRVPRRTMLEGLRASGLVADRIFTYDRFDHMFYAGHKVP
jgi:SAM-dependent methyltransferase